MPPFLPRSEDLQPAEEPSLGGLDVFGSRQSAQTAKKCEDKTPSTLLEHF